MKSLSTTVVAEKIINIRGLRVILDSDLALLYGVSTKRLNEQVKRNLKRFPIDFLIKLTAEEVKSLGAELNRSQFATGSQKHRDPRFLPYAFSEHGAIMAANVLNSPKAVQMSVYVVRAFIKMRSLISDQLQLTQKLRELEKELKGRLDIHEAAIVDVLHRVMKILEPSPTPLDKKKPRIGFRTKKKS